MKASVLLASSLVFLLASPHASAQAVIVHGPTSPSAPAITGQVMGHVTCSDTDGPGRFASVQLIAVKQSEQGAFEMPSMDKNPDFAKAIGVVMGSLMKGSNLSTLSAIDGAFSLAQVPIGTYYAVAQMPGYLSPLSNLSTAERMKAAADTLKALESSAQKITVEPNQTSRVDLRLERGSSLNGAIRYDDGSPAAGVIPTLLNLQPDGTWKPLQTSIQPAPTDDRGQFRISGIGRGKYAVQAALPTVQASAGLGVGSISMHMNMGDALVVYSGGALREKDIKPIDVGAGEDVTGVEIIFPLSGLHSISGSVVAHVDKHPLNRGTVTLLDPDTKGILRSVLLDASGAFRLNYVPEGSYLLRVSGLADAESQGGPEELNTDFARLLNSKVTKTYGNIEQTITVTTDVPTLTLQAPDPPKSAQQTPPA